MSVLDISVKIEVEDKKLKQLTRRLKAVEGGVRVGFFDNQRYTRGRNKDTSVSVPYVAYFNEVSPGERPFMRATAHSRETKKALKEAVNNILVGGQRRDHAYGDLGRKIQAQMRHVITSPGVPPNTPATIARKEAQGYGNRPLIETGTMLKAVKWKVIKKPKLASK